MVPPASTSLGHSKAGLVIGSPHSDERVLHWKIRRTGKHLDFLSQSEALIPFQVYLFPKRCEEGGI